MADPLGPAAATPGAGLHIRQVTAIPCRGFDGLRAQARAETHRVLDRLAVEWEAGTRFDRPGEALLGAWRGLALAGVGGITLDPALPGALRMRRFYVHPACRHAGTGRVLAQTLLRQVRRTGMAVVVNAGTTAASSFWEALGFVAEAGGGHTHRLPPVGPFSALLPGPRALCGK